MARAVATKTCASCGTAFPLKQVIDGTMRSLYRRRFCLVCSPFGVHNTSKSPPPAAGTLEELREHRRRRRNAKTYRHQKTKRKKVKAELVAARGGRCEDCGYLGAAAVLEFHHREASTKDFAIGAFSGSRARLLAEVEKCDLLCANCHRLRHLTLAADVHDADLRRRTKLRAIEWFGNVCHACDRRHAPPLLEFHHWNSSEKDFGISQAGVVRPWERIVAELAKCVMLCANCHREVHAGVRELDEGLLGLAEPLAPYRAA